MIILYPILSYVDIHYVPLQRHKDITIPLSEQKATSRPVIVY